MTPLDRPTVITAVREELDAHAQQCREEHAALGARVADRLGLLEPAPAPAPTPATEDLLDLGLWIDDAPKLVLTDAYLARLLGLPLSHFAVMVERSGGGLDLTWTTAQLAKLAAAAPEHERVLTLWPEPTAPYMTRLRQVLPGLLRALGRSPRTGHYVLEFDLEGHWKVGKVSGYASLTVAGATLMRIVTEVAAELGEEIEVEVTTFTAHVEATAKGKVLGEKRLLLQTYPVAQARDGTPRDYDGPLGPARRPYEEVLRARAAAEPGVEVCSGLAAWYQAGWPGGPDAAMATAVDAARRAGVRRVRWWSARHAIGASANSYAARGIEAARPLSLRARPA